MERWLAELEAGRPEAAWDAFLARYRRLVFAAIRHYVQDHDDVMDAFAQVCEGLRENDLHRLRAYERASNHPARFSTWLVVVVRNLCVDWIRQQYGRPRETAATRRLTSLQRRIHELVFTGLRSHSEAYELIRSRDGADLTFGTFLRELTTVYRVVTGGRGRLPREMSAPPPPESRVDAVDRIGIAETRQALAKALACLSAVDRAAVQMYLIDELPAADVARVLGLSNAKAVYNRVYRAMAAVREELERVGLRREDL